MDPVYGLCSSELAKSRWVRDLVWKRVPKSTKILRHIGAAYKDSCLDK